ncbi:MAG: putative addiction module antidote protein [Deltaproteobacteria bacterium]|jgi:probable addiction module antidote protein|nr:putative addiction module antidote protein [Deltaproteobacteria bacterium]
MKKLKTTKWDILDYLDNEKAIAAYLSAAIAENNLPTFITAIGDVVRARGVNDMAKKMKVGRESLYKSFSGKTKPNFETVIKALDILGVKINVLPKTKSCR